MKPGRCLYVTLVGLLLATMLSGATWSFADVPTQMSYQGLLLDSNGIPLDGNYNMTFSIYADSTGGTPLWVEMHNNSTRQVTVNDGLFEVVLGEFVPITPGFFGGSPRWLQTTVSGEDLCPRKPLTSAPSALRAAVADSISGSAWRWVYDGEVEVYTTDAGSDTYIDLDLSGIIGRNRSLVILKVRNDDPSPVNFTCRTNGESDTVGYTSSSQFGGGISGLTVAPNHIGYVMVVTDEGGIIEHKIVNANRDYTIYLVAHQRM